MVCCCDPFEPLSPEEMQESAEMIKSMQAEKASQAAKTSTAPEDGIQAETADAEMEELLVSVVLPPGVYPGQKIEVRSPDGTRTVDTVIPVGLHPGQAFLVKFPPVPKTTLKLQGSLASVREYIQDGVQEREEAESERGGGEREDHEEVDQSPSFVQVLDDFLTPKPDPDVIEAMEKAKKEAAEAQTRKTKLAPTPEAGAGGKATRDTVGNPDAPTQRERNNQERLQQSNSSDDQSQGSRSIRSVVSTHIKKVQGEAVQASVTRVAAEPVNGSGREGPEEKTSKESQVAEELYSSSSFVKSLEDFFTPKPDVPPSKAPEKADPEASTNAPVPMPMQTTPNQKLVLVHVPPELLPGTTIYVEIPGESRTVAAQVPPGVTSFHVAYTPQQPLAHAPVPPMMANGDMVLRQPQVGREKLLSVRVPPGTLPGTTLHISVPDEPGRILAAQVPPGNVKKFHVSYIPREQASLSGNGMLPPASPYQQYQAAYHASHYQDRYAPASYSGHSSSEGQSP